MRSQIDLNAIFQKESDGVRAGMSTLNEDAGGVDWTSWSAFEWNAALLHHYFAKNANRGDGSVGVLNVLDDEFSRIVGDVNTPPKEIAASFVKKTNKSVGDSGFWQKAEEKRLFQDEPLYLPYLFLACLASIDAEDEEERSFLERFDSISDGKGSHRIETMAELWHDLASWLESQDEYRDLLLPDPGGWTRIGHTVRLSFPSRSDQYRLHRSIEDAALLVDSPPIGAVLSAVRNSASSFRPRFREEFELFADAHENGIPTSQLQQTPFWAAVERVVEISLDAGFEGSSHQWSIIAEDDGYEVLPLVVCEADVLPIREFDLSEALDDHGWPFEASAEDTAAFFDRAPTGFGQLGSLVRGGLVPLVDTRFGVLQAASKSEVENVSVALVRDDVLETVSQKFGGSPMGVNLSGWSVLRGADLNLVESSALEGTPLERCWILHKAIFPATIRTVGGIAVDGGFYGDKAMVPKFRAAGAASAIAEHEDRVFELINEGDGLFSFPQDLVGDGLRGEARVYADFEDGTRAQSFQFHRSPTVEEFRFPGDMRPFVLEGMVKGRSYEGTVSGPADAVTFFPGADDDLFLGQDVGVFAASKDDATWVVTHAGGRSFARLTGAESAPRAVNQDKSLARKWRKHLKKAEYSDPLEQDLALSAIRFVEAATDLKSEPLYQDPPKAARPHGRLDSTVELLVARANARAGFGIGTFLDTIEKRLDVPPERKWLVLRSWCEAGLLDDAISTRYSRQRKLFAVQPTVEVFQSDSFVVGRMTGLSLPRSISDLQSVAENEGVFADIQGSVSQYTPATVVLRAPDLEEISSLCSRMGIRWRAAASPQKEDNGPDQLLQAPSTHETRYRPLSAERCPSARVQQWTQKSSPTYWEAVTEDSPQWYLHRSNAEFATALLNDCPVVQRVGRTLFSTSAHVPLPLARWLNLVATLQSGPDSENRYAYHCPSNAIADEVIRVVDYLGQVVRGVNVEEPHGA